MDQNVIINEYLSKLPEIIQQAISSMEWKKKISEISAKYKLNPQQVLSLNNEILFVVTGMDLETNLVTNLTENIGVSTDQANKIAEDIGNDLLLWLDEQYTKANPAKDKQGLAKNTRLAIQTKIKNDLPDQIKNLPQERQNFIFAGAWQERTDEVAKKYSLNPTQTDTLINNVLFVLIGLDTPETFTRLMTSELGISQLLAEQIMEDLGVRVFEYAVKSIENKTNNNQKSTTDSQQETQGNQQNPVSKGIFDTKSENDIPEIRPENLPAIEPGETAHDSPKSSVGETSPRTRLGEEVQRPISVPRYMATPAEEKIEPVIKPQEIPRTPLGQSAPEPTKTPEPVTPPVHKYTVDPYREPLE